MVKPLIISALDRRGGAAKAAYRLHRGLLDLGLASRMLVQSKSGDDPEVITPSGRPNKLVSLARPALDSGIARLVGRSRSEDFFPALLPFSPIRREAAALAPDIINLHWVCGGMLRIEEIPKLAGPLVWTFHDMWPFTGGCNYSGDCVRYEERCGQCPQLARSGASDLSSRIHRRKQRAFADLDITVVCPSRWLADLARRSSLFGPRQIEVIPYGLDLGLFKPVEQSVARSIWNLPRDAPLLLFGAVKATSGSRKGFDLLQQMLSRLRREGVEDAQLVIFGAAQPTDPPNLHYPARYVGPLEDEISLSLLYSAADVTVVPSREDNLPNVAIESLACGTPVAGFDVGGMGEIVTHRGEGFLAPPEDPDNLARGVAWILQQSREGDALRQNARRRAQECFSSERCATRYRNLFEQLTAEGNG